MNDLLFAFLCVAGLAIDALLLNVLLRRTLLNPALRREGRNTDVVVSPFVISGDPAASHLHVEGSPDLRVHVYCDGPDGDWRVTNLGTAPVSLNGRALRAGRVLRLFDGNEIRVGATTLAFKHAGSLPIRPRFAGYAVRGHPYSGGTSLVYPATEKKGGRDALLKVRDPSQDDEDIDHLNARIRREHDLLARVVRNCSGDLAPRFPAVFDLLEDEGGYLAIAMEHVHGVTLRKTLESRKPTPAEVARFGLALAHALELLASVDVVHCDLKPDNVVLREGRWDDPCLVDFGAAVETGERAKSRTAGYESPEHPTEPVGPPADVYVMGTLLAECLAGGDPAEAEVRRTLDGLIARMRSPEPDARPSAGQVREELAAVLGVA